MTKTQKDLDAQAKALRAKGLTYAEIGQKMKISSAKAWAHVNRERRRETIRESCARYRARGYTSLA